MIRKTRLMSRAGVMMVRSEHFDSGILRATVFTVSTPFASQTFTSMTKAIRAFRAMARRPAEAPALKRAA